LKELIYRPLGSSLSQRLHKGRFGWVSVLLICSWVKRIGKKYRVVEAREVWVIKGVVYKL
jgi:hypothetical protein